MVTGLGVDSVASLPGDMFSLMRSALLASQIAEDPRFTVRDVLRMATIDGAAALGLAARIGSLRPAEVFVRGHAAGLGDAPGRGADEVLVDTKGGGASRRSRCPSRSRRSCRRPGA